VARCLGVRVYPYGGQDHERKQKNRGFSCKKDGSIKKWKKRADGHLDDVMRDWRGPKRGLVGDVFGGEIS